MKILIIGGSGYIGTRLGQLLSVVCDVSTVDLEWFGVSHLAGNAVVDYKNLPHDYLGEFDVIILLAAYASSQLCENNGYKVFQNDVTNFYHLFEKIKVISKGKHIKFIYASSGSIYGKQEGLCLESHPSREVSNFYDLSKRLNDDYCLLNIKDVEFYGLRFGTVNGWSPHLRVDVMINAMKESAEKNGFISCSSVDQYRAILDIQDLCSAVVSIILSADDKRGIYNLASFNMKIGDIAKQVADALRCGVKYSDGNSCYSFQLDCSKIMKAFPTLELNGSITSILNSLNMSSSYKSIRR